MLTSANDIAEFLEVSSKDTTDLFQRRTWYHIFSKLSDVIKKNPRGAAGEVLRNFGEFSSRIQNSPLPSTAKTKLALQLYKIQQDGRLPDGSALHPSQKTFLAKELANYGESNLQLALAEKDFWRPTPGRNGLLRLLRPPDATPGEADDLPSTIRFPKRSETYIIDSHGQKGLFSIFNHKGEIEDISPETVVALMKQDPEYEKTTEIFMTQCFSGVSRNRTENGVVLPFENRQASAQRIATLTGKPVVASAGHTRFHRVQDTVYIWIEDGNKNVIPMERAFRKYLPGGRHGQPIGNLFDYVKQSDSYVHTRYEKPEMKITDERAPEI